MDYIMAGVNCPKCRVGNVINVDKEDYGIGLPCTCDRCGYGFTVEADVYVYPTPAPGKDGATCSYCGHPKNSSSCQGQHP